MADSDRKKRGRGRPPASGKSGDGLVNRQMIVDLAYEQGRTQSLDDISFTQLAKDLGVKPGALHYHIGTKDDLTSAILNRFYKELLAEFSIQPVIDDWRETLARFARTLMNRQRAHMGAAQHIQRHAKFRIFQRVRDGETDYGARFLDHIFCLLRDTGFPPQTAALCYHVLALHCLSAANSDNSQLEPAAHEAFLTARATAYDKGEMPGLEYGLLAFARVRAEDAFELGLTAILDRFAAIRASEQ